MSFPIIMIQNTVTILIYMMTFTAGITQRITSPQLSQLQNLCPGEEVIITCETRGSVIIAWTSDEYIEAGGTQMEFTTFSDVGDTRVSPVNPSTIATLINKTNENGDVVLVSTLHIRTLSQFTNSSVTCINIGSGTYSTTRLHVLGDPDIPQALLAHQTASDSGNCIMHLFWSLPNTIAPEDISHFIIHIDGILVANETRSTNENFFLTAYRLCSCGSHSISISAVNRCGRSGRSGLMMFEGRDQLPTPQLTMECQDSTTTGGNLINTGNPTSVVNLITLIAVSSSVMVFVLSSVIFFIFGYICGYKHKQTRTTGQASVDHDVEETQPVQQHGQSEMREQDIEMNQNVAYGPVYRQVCMTTQA